MKIIKLLKDYILLVVGGLSAFCIGLIGRLIPYGNEVWNFFFENLIWFPIELAITLIFVERIINRNNKKIKHIREFEEYYSLAEEDLQNIIYSVKVQLISAYTNTQVSNKEVDKKIADISENFDRYINVENLRMGFNTRIVDRQNIFESIRNPIFGRKSYFISLEEYGSVIPRKIEKHLNLFIKFIPVDIFRELNTIVNEIEKNIYFSSNPNLHFSRQMLLQREEEDLMTDEEYQQTVDFMRDFFHNTIEGITNLTNNIEKNRTQHT